MKLKLKTCTCWRCGYVWEDFPGAWAQKSRLGCPNCGHLYWTEVDVGVP